MWVKNIAITSTITPTIRPAMSAKTQARADTEPVLAPNQS